MKSKIAHIIIILLNTILIGFLIYSLNQEYLETGKFQWVDQAKIEDNEELLLTPISVGISTLAILSILYQTLKYHNIYFKNFITKILYSFIQFMSFMYGIIMLSLVIVMAIVFVSKYEEHGSLRASEIFLLMIVSLGVAVLGGLVIIKSTEPY